MQVSNSYILLIEAYSARLQDMQLNASPAVQTKLYKDQ